MNKLKQLTGYTALPFATLCINVISSTYCYYFARGAQLHFHFRFQYLQSHYEQHFDRIVPPPLVHMLLLQKILQHQPCISAVASHFVHLFLNGNFSSSNFTSLAVNTFCFSGSHSRYPFGAYPTITACLLFESSLVLF